MTPEELKALEAALLAINKPALKATWVQVIIPLIQKYEDKIGTEPLKIIIEGVTATLEAQVTAVLS